MEEEPLTKKKDDINKVTSLFTEYIGVETAVTNAVRIGKKGNKPRLLKVGVSNLQDKISILRRLRSDSNPGNIRSVFITADYTPLEKKQVDIIISKNQALQI